MLYVIVNEYVHFIYYLCYLVCCIKKRPADKNAKNILITGAAGTIGVEVRGFLLNQGFNLYSCDRIPFKKIHSNEKIFNIDIRHMLAIACLFESCSSIIHLAGAAYAVCWNNVLSNNINGTYHIFETARKVNIKRVIFASSVHVTGFYPVSKKVDINDLPRPDSFYGVSKLFGENIGQLYFDKYNIQTFSLRIGSYKLVPTNKHDLGFWLSPRDFNHLLLQCLNSTYKKCLTIYATSNNSNSFYINASVKEINYFPIDNAEDYSHLIDIDNYTKNDELQGGHFCRYGL